MHIDNKTVQKKPGALLQNKYCSLLVWIFSLLWFDASEIVPCVKWHCGAIRPNMYVKDAKNWAFRLLVVQVQPWLLLSV